MPSPDSHKVEDSEMSVSVAEELLERKDWEPLQTWLSTLPPPEIADVLTNASEQDRVLVFRTLPRSLSVEVFSYLDKDLQESLLIQLTDEEARQLLSETEADDRTVLLEGLPEELGARIFNLLSPRDRQEARRLLGYPKESVGRLMTPNYLSVRPEWTVGEALDYVRRRGPDVEFIGVIYVTDGEWRLLDAMPLESFVLARPADRVTLIMDKSFVALSPHDDREQAVRKMQKYDLLALPVVNENGILLGVVTADDVLDVAEEEATEDIQKGAAVEPLKASYRDSTVWALYQKRIPWLVVLMFVNLAASGVIAMYQETLSSALALAFFIPLLMGCGGNTGSQSATLMVRALATEDFKVSQWLNAVMKEIAVGTSIGLTLGIGVGLIGYLEEELVIGIAVGFAMGAIVLVSNLLGVLFPLVLTKLRIDPAVASSPMVTSTADVSSLFLYFSIATLVLGGIGAGGA